MKGRHLKVNRYRGHRTVLVFWAGLSALLAAAPAAAQTTGGYTISTVAGILGFSFGYAGDGGPATQAQFWGLFDVTVDTSGNLYIADQLNDRIRKVSGGTINTFAGDGTAGYYGDNGAATSAELNEPTGVGLDTSGNVYIADYKNSVIRKVSTSGTITTVAGDNGAGAGYSGDNAAATSAQLDQPVSVVADSAGNLYIADTTNNRIRKVTASTGYITTLAGSALTGYQGDGAEAVDALLNTPVGIAVDSAGNVYFSDSENHVIRKIATNGIITTIAGDGAPTGSTNPLGDGGPATNASLFYPKGIALDQQGNLYVADYTNQRIRKIFTNGIIQTIAGMGDAGSYGDGGVANLAELNFPTGVSVDSSGNVYIADSENFAVRKLTPVAPSINSGGVVTASAFGGFGSVAPGSWIEIYGSALGIDTRTWENSDFNGVVAPTSLDGTSVTVGGQSAYVEYVSPGQVNAQVPFTVATGSQPLVVMTPSASTSTYTVTVNALEPGLVAPASFVINGKQYVAATFTDGVTYVLPPGAIPGVTSREAKPGDTIVLYGVGFGPVSPAIAAGQIVQQSNSLANPVAFSFGGTPAAAPGYAGLAPGYVGLYQFNVVVPTAGANDLTPLTFTQAGTNSTQTLYIAIGN
jgi:trimeric autotransporter adhesin